MSYIFFSISIVLIVVAHILRVTRWKQFISVYEQVDDRILIQSLSLGYFLNMILPFKIGEIFRAIYASKKMKNGKALGFSTVIVDRLVDLIFVGVIFTFYSFLDNNFETRRVGKNYIFVALIIIATMFVFFVCRGQIKRIIKHIASIFNDKIEAQILFFSWALIWNFKNILYRINKVKFVVLTCLMWVFYFTSYYLYSRSCTINGADIKLFDVLFYLFSGGRIETSVVYDAVSQTTEILGNTVIYLIYMILPVVILFVLSFGWKTKGKIEEKDSFVNLLPHLDSDERLRFLENYFSNENNEYLSNYLKINQNISIIRDYSAGSNATTMLCMNGETTFFRKYAFEGDGDKLYEQVQWIEKYNDKLTLPQILEAEKTDIYCYYDMPYNANSVGLFEYVHSMPTEQSWKLIKEVLKSLDVSIYQINRRPADIQTIKKYISCKVQSNIKKIINAKYIKDLQKYDELIINGVSYKNIRYFATQLSEESLLNIFKNDIYATIHGDLTIENVICTRSATGKDSFYIIDPNTGNMHDSPFLDYAKLLQSIHGGYEFLMSTKDVLINKNKIDFLFTKSAAYIELHKNLRNYIEEKFGLERTKSIYFHEIIHWLRLMPYKIEKNGKRALIFYAGLIMVLNDVDKMYGDK